MMTQGGLFPPTPPSGGAPEPLAHRMSPRDLREFVGQDHLLGSGRPLALLIERDRISSCVFYGPSGCGKTAVARIIAKTTRARFERLNAVTDGVADIRRVTGDARRSRAGSGRPTILFIDEIHRFNRSQQDALLPFVEDGTVVCIGATTENPLFSVNTPLLSRMRIYQFLPLTREQLLVLIKRAADDTDRGVGTGVDDDAAAEIARLAGGDARVALNLLELAADIGQGRISAATVSTCVRDLVFRYDRAADAHYDHASALIKSMRGSDPDAAVYWLLRMLEGGEDPMFVARRIIICAAEDVGLADPMALTVAVAAASATHTIGMPECRLVLTEAVLYVASAPKSNAVYRAMNAAVADIRSVPIAGVPVHLRDSGARGERLGHGVDYRYPHDFPHGYVTQRYLPEELAGRRYYLPTERGAEQEIGSRLREWREGADEEGSAQPDTT